MRIDWKNLPTLIGPRFWQVQRERDSRERLAIAHMRRAKGPKKHSTNKERSHADRMKAATSKRLIEEQHKDLEMWRAAVRAYWKGESGEHP